MEIRLVDLSMVSPPQMPFVFTHDEKEQTILMMPNVGGRLLSIDHSRDLWRELVRTGWVHL